LQTFPVTGLSTTTITTYLIIAAGKLHAFVRRLIRHVSELALDGTQVEKYGSLVLYEHTTIRTFYLIFYLIFYETAPSIFVIFKNAQPRTEGK
jgi:hypothetical protein